MQGDKRWTATQVDSRYKKSSKKAPAPKGRKVSEESEDKFDWSEVSSSEELDLEKVNELLGAELHDLDEEAEEQDAWSDPEDNQAPLFEGQSRRLALMNYDWTKIKAGDIMITFSSFLPDGGVLKSVKIYPSEFGKKMMEQEEKEGPGDIFKANSTLEIADKPGQRLKAVQPEEDTNKSIRPHKFQRQTETPEWTAGIEEEQSALDLAKLRKYERDRLKYYYAVLEFDSPATADAVFEASNGFELEIKGIRIGNFMLYLRSESSSRRLEVPFRTERSVQNEASKGVRSQLPDEGTDTHQRDLHMGRARDGQQTQRDPVQRRHGRQDLPGGLHCTRLRLRSLDE